MVEIEASKPQLEFKKGASSTLVNIWKGDVAPTILEGHSTKKNPVKRIDQQLFVIARIIIDFVLKLQPFPKNPDDVAHNLKAIIKDSECDSYRIYSLTPFPYNYTAFEGSVLVYDLDSGKFSSGRSPLTNFRTSSDIIRNSADCEADSRMDKDSWTIGVYTLSR